MVITIPMLMPFIFHYAKFIILGYEVIIISFNTASVLNELRLFVKNKVYLLSVPKLAKRNQTIFRMPFRERCIGIYL